MHTGLGKMVYKGKKGERKRGILSESGTERARMARPAFKGCLAPAHRGKTWLCNKLMTSVPRLAYAHKGFV